ncbi:hypothetical protein ATI53_102449 [Salipiger aestuarii]|uniref:Uncharacterized protein n=1 Tax=Salipiger aestuarii TaxID=568098 RepID=A0A327Y2Q1_9RHOB|nr:hypothetical protein ATI53_102449 [Salipiger aestuarii]
MPVRNQCGERDVSGGITRTGDAHPRRGAVPGSFGRNEPRSSTWLKTGGPNLRNAWAASAPWSPWRAVSQQPSIGSGSMVEASMIASACAAALSQRGNSPHHRDGIAGVYRKHHRRRAVVAAQNPNRKRPRGLPVTDGFGAGLLQPQDTAGWRNPAAFRENAQAHRGPGAGLGPGIVFHRVAGHAFAKHRFSPAGSVLADRMVSQTVARSLSTIYDAVFSGSHVSRAACHAT